IEPGLSRGIRILSGGGADAALGPRDELPLIGRVSAGSPILAEENVENRMKLSGNLFKPRADYLLRVKGDSMKDAGIEDRDIIAVHKTDEAKNGAIVVARINNEVTVKRLRRGRGDMIELLPENRNHKPIRVDPRRDNFAIEGTAVGILRML